MPYDNLDSAHMKLVQWVRFTWELDKLPTLGAALPAHYFLTAANRADEKELRAAPSQAGLSLRETGTA